MKKLTIALSALLLTASLLAGCGSKAVSSAPASEAAVAESTATEPAESAAGEKAWEDMTLEEQQTAWDGMDGETAYATVAESKDSWCVTAYDLVNTENVKDFVILYANWEGVPSFNLNWPPYGGYDPKIIASIGDMRGKGSVEVSRSGGDGGYTMCFGTNPDGSQYTPTQRSVPSSSATVNTGVLDIDRYLASVDVIAGDGEEAEKLEALAELGFEEDAAKTLMENYAAWFTRAEISGENSIPDGIALAGNEVESMYGYYGICSEWPVCDITLEGGSAQMNTVYSWGALKTSGLLTDVGTAEIGLPQS